MHFASMRFLNGSDRSSRTKRSTLNGKLLSSNASSKSPACDFCSGDVNMTRSRSVLELEVHFAREPWIQAVVLGRCRSDNSRMVSVLQRRIKQIILAGQPENRLGVVRWICNAQFSRWVSLQHLPEAVVVGLEALDDRFGN